MRKEEKYLLEEFTPLVRKIAGGFQRKLPRNILHEDLLAAGMGGLWDAIKRRSRSSDNFEWYVRVRIRGAIVDELRAQDWLPRRWREAERNQGLAPVSIIRAEDLTDAEQKALFFNDTNADVLLDAKRQRLDLMRFIDALPNRERHIIAEHYFNEVKFKDLGAELGVSEPRISQLHSRALERLRLIAAGQEPIVRRRRRAKPTST